ncbi:MAG: hypothetical protein WDN45_04395 [Caulobacteraceae bacterium]
MPRYFFNVQDGVAVDDREGAECVDLGDARGEAVRRVAAMLGERTDEFWRDAYWKLSVADERGLTLFSIEISASLAPVVKR